MEEKSPEQLIAESEKLMDESQRPDDLTKIISRLTMWLVIGGIVGPCLWIVVMTLAGQ